LNPGYSVYLSEYPPHEKRLKQLAAQVQETFDCKLFDLAWHETKIGEKPSREIITENSSAYFNRRAKDPKVKDWYSPCVSEVSLPAARMICQRLNVGWNARQRRSYANWLLVFIKLLILIPILITRIRNMFVADALLSFAVPLSPALI
jgi:hypothetical protein